MVTYTSNLYTIAGKKEKRNAGPSKTLKNDEEKIYKYERTFA